MNIEQAIWSIFTYATLHGNPRDPSKLTSTGLSKLCKECRIFDASMVDKPISSAQIHLIFAQEAKNAAEKTDPKLRALQHKMAERIDYNGFLNCLIRIAPMCYPNSKSGDDAMLHLLMENLLPLATRRNPIATVASCSELSSIKSYFEAPLQEVFDFYAANAANYVTARQLAKTATSGGSNGPKTFDDHEQHIAALQKQSHASNDLYNDEKSITYQEFMRFSVDFGLQASLGMTTLDVGNVYLSSCASRGKFRAEVQRINFDKFWEALVRCSQEALEEYKYVTNDIKMKTLFLYMWRHIQSSMREQMQGDNGTGSLSSYKGGLVRGAQLLNERFLSMWAKDSYRDYLKPISEQDSSFVTGGQGNKIQGSALLNSLTAAASIDRTDTDDDDDDDDNNTTGNKITHREVIIDIHDDDDLGDDRLDPVQMRHLLHKDPELANLLYDIAEEEGLLQDDDDVVVDNSANTDPDIISEVYDEQ